MGKKIVDRVCEICEENLVNVIDWNNDIRYCKKCKAKNKDFSNEDEDELYNILKK